MSKNTIVYKNKYAEQDLPNDSLSIIVPVFNTEEYVLDALHSLEGERPGRHEIIVVHDGGTDGSLAIVRQWASTTSSPVIIIDQENQGLSAARHAGLEVATGNFVAFLDSDDFVVPGLYGRMMDLALNHNCDMVLCHAQVLNELDGGFWDFYDSWLWDKILRGRHFAITNIYNDPLLFRLEPNANRRLIRHKFLKDNDIRFERGMLFEDLPPHVDELALASRVGLWDESGYFYRVNRAGKITEEKGMHRFDMIKSSRLSLDKGKAHNLEPLAGAALLSGMIRMVFWCGEFIFISQRKDYFDQACTVFKNAPTEWVNSLESFWGWNHRDSILIRKFRNADIDFLMKESFEHNIDESMQDFLPEEVRHSPALLRHPSLLSRVIGKLRSFVRMKLI